MSAAFGTIFQPWRPEDLVERWGGFIVALAVTASATLISAFWALEAPRLVERILPLTITLAPPAPTAVAEPETLQAPDPAFEETAATTVNPSEAEAFRADASPGSIAEGVLDQLAAFRDWRPTTAGDFKALEDLRANMLDHRDRLERDVRDLDAEIMRRSVESHGKEFLLNSDGGRAGIVRTLDLEGFPESTALQVLRRYGIGVEFRHVKPNPADRRFLTAARTDKGTFANLDAEGYYEVFVLSGKAVALMASLETTALMERGFEPRNTRIKRITFGIVKDRSGELALGVTDLQVEQLR